MLTDVHNYLGIILFASCRLSAADFTNWGRASTMVKILGINKLYSHKNINFDFKFMKKKILLTYTNFSSFVKTDFEILSEIGLVDKYQFKSRKNVGGIVEVVKQFFFLIFKGYQYDIFFTWFADHHSFLPVLYTRIFGKKSFVVIGGYDVARIPELGYGVFNSKIRGFCAIQTMKKSELNLTVSKYVDRKVRWIAPKAKTQLIYNCVSLPNNNSIVSKENEILTVGLIDSERTFFLKGIDTFIEVAKLLPTYKFTVVGGEKALLEKYAGKIPDNIEIVGRIHHQELVKYYEKAKIYCQFSRSESFGVAIAEAMSFGCVPIVTNVGGMPEVLGKTGFIVKRNSNNISRIIQEVIINCSSLRIKEKKNEYLEFSLNKRKKRLLSIINNFS